MTLTRTLAWRRSGVVSTLVTVANPIRGSSTSRARIAVISSRRSSSIRSVRCVIARSGSLGRASGGQDPRHRLGDEAFDDVSFLQIVVVGQADAALVVLLDLADVVPEPAQRLDPIRRHDPAGTPDAGTTADDPAVRHEAAGDDGALADAEDLANLRPALHDLDDLGLEESLERRGHVVRQLVDDVVQADVDALGFRRPAGRVGDLCVEADDDRVRGGRQHDVVVGDVAGALVEDVDPDLLLVELLEGVADGTERAGHVGLEDDPELLGLTRLDLAVEVLEGRATARVAGLRGHRRAALLD